MGLVLAFIAGYVIGARDGSEALDEVIDAAKAVAASQEFEDLVRALRSHAGHVLQEVGRRVDPSSGRADQREHDSSSGPATSCSARATGTES